jgi:hypothetical protein
MVRQRSNETGPHVRPSCGRKRERGLVFVRNPATTGVSTHVPGGPYRACYRLTGIPRRTVAAARHGTRSRDTGAGTGRLAGQEGTPPGQQHGAGAGHRGLPHPAGAGVSGARRSIGINAMS